MSTADAAAEAADTPPRGRTERRVARLQGAGGTDEHVVMYFKERIYATFTGLAIVLVVTANDNPRVGHAALALILGVLGITAAGFVSDVISHLVVHREFPSAPEFGILLRISAGALGTLVTPLLLLALVVLDVLVLDAALIAAIVVYVVTLGLIGWFAVRRSRIAWWKQVIAMVMLMVLGLIVVVLQTLAHRE
jgi:hypothetical protein